MITTSFFDILVFIAFFSLSIDIILQIIQLRKEKDSREISLKGEFIRLFAVTVFLIRFLMTKDFVMAIGQVVFLTIFISYLIFIGRYRNPTQNNKNNPRVKK